MYAFIFFFQHKLNFYFCSQCPSKHHIRSVFFSYCVMLSVLFRVLQHRQQPEQKIVTLLIPRSTPQQKSSIPGWRGERNIKITRFSFIVIYFKYRYGDWEVATNENKPLNLVQLLHLYNFICIINEILQFKFLSLSLKGRGRGDIVGNR